jgi:formylglycine-generating enzyme required for sulfatase activity
MNDNLKKHIVLLFIFCVFLAACKPVSCLSLNNSVTSEAIADSLPSIPTPTTTSTPSLAIPGTIVYSGLYGVYEINLQQGNVTTWVEENRLFLNVQVVGNDIYFIRTGATEGMPGAGWGPGQVFRINLSTGDLERLTKEKYDESALAVATDGNHLAFITYGMAPEGTPKIVVIDTLSGTSKVATTCKNPPFYPQLSPNGENLVYFEPFELSDQTAKLLMVNINNGSQVQLLHDFTIPITRLSFSPDGKYLALGVVEDQGYGIYAYDIHNSKIDKIAVVEGQPKKFQWSPDGKSIMYEEEMSDGHSRLSIIDISTKAISTIAEESEGLSFVAIWSPNNDAVAYFTESNSDVSQLIVQYLKTGKTRVYEVAGSFIESAAWVIYPEVMQTRTRVADGMKEVYVSAGEFVMGAAASDTGAGSNELPLHTVYLDAYWIDQHEVTNGQYERCVAAGACTEPHNFWTNSRENYYGNTLYTNYPVVNVDWYQAGAYCEWVGGRLPTESEWEKAARGIDGRIYPWGNQALNADLLNIDQDIYDTTEVCHYPAGNSPYGACDMAGNVWEWVKDRYNAKYYTVSPISNPQGAESGYQKVCRGGVRASTRGNQSPDDWTVNLGFRCARSQ